MPFQPVPGVAEFRMEQAIAVTGVPPVDMINTLYLEHASGEWTESDLTAAAPTVRDRWIARVIPHQSSSIRFIGIKARDLTTEFGAQHEITANAVGGLASESSSTALAFPVTLLGEAGRAPRRGRLFIPGVAESDAVVNQITIARRDALSAAVLLMLQELDTTNWTPVIISRYHKSFVTPTNERGLRPVAEVNPIDSVRVTLDMWSQRDRRPGRLG